MLSSFPFSFLHFFLTFATLSSFPFRTRFWSFSSIYFFLHNFLPNYFLFSPSYFLLWFSSILQFSFFFSLSSFTDLFFINSYILNSTDCFFFFLYYFFQNFLNVSLFLFPLSSYSVNSSNFILVNFPHNFWHTCFLSILYVTMFAVRYLTNVNFLKTSLHHTIRLVKS